MMKNYILYKSYVFLFLLFLLSKGCYQHDSFPVSIVPQTVILKDSEAGSKILFSLSMTNATNRTVNKLDIAASCGCLLVSDSPASLPSNITQDCTFQFSVPQRVGPFKHIIEIKVEGAKKSAFIPVIGNATKTLDSFPQSLLVSLSDRIGYVGKSFTLKVSAKNAKDCVLMAEIQSLSKNRGENNEPAWMTGLSVSLSRIDGYSFSGVFSVNSKELKTDLPFNGLIAIKNIADRGKVILSIPFKISDAPEIECFPNLLSFYFDHSANKYSPVTLRLAGNKLLDAEAVFLINSKQKIEFEQQLFTAVPIRCDTQLTLTPSAGSIPAQLRFDNIDIQFKNGLHWRIPTVFYKTGENKMPLQALNKS
ncbi:MAG: hypothetical protein AB1656_17260 [Candidatus Omnitrophota bacterium]